MDINLSEGLLTNSFYLFLFLVLVSQFVCLFVFVCQSVITPICHFLIRLRFQIHNLQVF